MKDYMLIHGYRFSPLVMIYESISLTNYSFKGKVSDQGTLDSDKISRQADNILGFQLGLALGSPTLSIKTEVGIQRIKWSYTEEKQFYSFGSAINVGW